MTLEKRVRIGYGYLEHLKNEQAEYFVTLTYRYNYSDQLAEQGMRAFVLKLLNRLPRRTRRKFGGFVCAHRHTRVRFEGTYHFHFVFWGLDDSMPDSFDWLRINVQRAANELHPRAPGPNCDCDAAEKLGRRPMCRGGMSCRGPHMAGPESTDVQRIEHSPEVVDEYIVSDIFKLDRPAGSQLLSIGPSGVVGCLIDGQLD